jgi:Cys-tRNA(Pro)/Cys-tRNA(Cys) deacylase
MGERIVTADIIYPIEAGGGKIAKNHKRKGFSNMPIVNNVTRFLDARRIPYTAFETSPEKLGALDVAHLLDIEPDSVFKTIVVTREKPTSSPKGKKPLLVLVPGPSSVDLKSLAAMLGEKKVHLPTEREAEQLTGLQAGGISPLALINKGFQVIIDSSAQNFSEIHVSGGQRGVNIKLSVDDLVKLTNARFASVAGIPD